MKNIIKSIVIAIMIAVCFTSCEKEPQFNTRKVSVDYIITAPFNPWVSGNIYIEIVKVYGYYNYNMTISNWTKISDKKYFYKTETNFMSETEAGDAAKNFLYDLRNNGFTYTYDCYYINGVYVTEGAIRELDHIFWYNNK